MREKEIAIPAFREHLYGTEIVTVRHFFFALKSPCGASKPHPAYHLFQTVLARVRLSASVILASRYPLSGERKAAVVHGLKDGVSIGVLSA
jgi:hypothetical protein